MGRSRSATPCHILHLANCYEDGDWVVMDGCIMPDPHKPNVGQSLAEGRQAAYDKIRSHLDKYNNPTLMSLSLNTYLRCPRIHRCNTR